MKYISLCIASTITALFLGFVIGFFFTQQDSFKYPLLSWRIQNNTPHDIKINFRDLRLRIEAYVQRQGILGSRISVFFEYLPTGVSFSVNERNEKFIAASLMKVPVVMTAYALHDEGLLDLDSETTLKEEWLHSGYGTLYQKGIGHTITLREAARLALVDSDNTAILLLWDHIDQFITSKADVITHLNLDIETYQDESIGITPQSYSSILRCLYFSCYLTKDGSHEVLEFLSQSSFNHRMTKYIPSDIAVAHKIGSFQEDFQSDCGIVYAPHRPYILCVMVSGNEEEANRVIADISRIVFEFIRR